MQIKTILLGVLVSLIPSLVKEADEAIEPEDENLEKATDYALGSAGALLTKYANDGKITEAEKEEFVRNNKEAVQNAAYRLVDFGLGKLWASIK